MAYELSVLVSVFESTYVTIAPIIFSIFVVCSLLVLAVWQCACCGGKSEKQKRDYEDEEHERTAGGENPERRQSGKTSPRRKRAKPPESVHITWAKSEHHMISQTHDETTKPGGKKPAGTRRTAESVGETSSDALKMPTVFRATGLSPPKSVHPTTEMVSAHPAKAKTSPTKTKGDQDKNVDAEKTKRKVPKMSAKSIIKAEGRAIEATALKRGTGMTQTKGSLKPARHEKGGKGSLKTTKPETLTVAKTVISSPTAITVLPAKHTSDKKDETPSNENRSPTKEQTVSTEFGAFRMSQMPAMSYEVKAPRH